MAAEKPTDGMKETIDALCAALRLPIPLLSLASAALLAGDKLLVLGGAGSFPIQMALYLSSILIAIIFFQCLRMSCWIRIALQNRSTELPFNKLVLETSPATFNPLYNPFKYWNEKTYEGAPFWRKYDKPLMLLTYAPVISAGFAIGFSSAFCGSLDTKWPESHQYSFQIFRLILISVPALLTVGELTRVLWLVGRRIAWLIFICSAVISAGMGYFSADALNTFQPPKAAATVCKC